MNTDQQTGQRNNQTTMNMDQDSGKTNGARSQVGVIKHEGTTEKIIGVFFEVYNELGHGFLESVYAESMAIALREAGHRVIQQAPIAVYFGGQRVGDFRADLLVNDEVIVSSLITNGRTTDKDWPRINADEHGSTIRTNEGNKEIQDGETFLRVCVPQFGSPYREEAKRFEPP